MANQLKAHKDQRAIRALKGIPASKVKLGLLVRQACRASPDQPGPHHNSALSDHPAQVLLLARLHAVRMKSLSLHFAEQKELLQTISLSRLFHAGSIRTRRVVRLSWSARSSGSGADLPMIVARPLLALSGHSNRTRECPLLDA